MYTFSLNSSTQHSSPDDFTPSPALRFSSRPITSCMSCRSRKVKCDRRQPQCLVCERGNYACSYASKPQLPVMASKSSRISKSSKVSRMSSSTLARINPSLQRLGNFMAQARAIEASDHGSVSSDSFTTTRSTHVLQNASTPQPQSHEDSLVLDNGVPHFVSGKHWAWMAAEVCCHCPSSSRTYNKREILTNPLAFRSKTFNQFSRNFRNLPPSRALSMSYGTFIPLQLLQLTFGPIRERIAIYS